MKPRTYQLIGGFAQSHSVSINTKDRLCNPKFESQGLSPDKFMTLRSQVMIPHYRHTFPENSVETNCENKEKKRKDSLDGQKSRRSGAEIF